MPLTIFHRHERTKGYCSKCFKEMGLELPEEKKEEKEKPTDDTKSADEKFSEESAAEGNDREEQTASGDDKDDNLPEQKDKTRCFQCNRKVCVAHGSEVSDGSVFLPGDVQVGLLGIECRCGYIFCGNHRYSDRHGCTFDFKTNARRNLSKLNPQVQSDKIERL